MMHPDPYEWTPDEEDAWRFLEEQAAYHDRLEWMAKHGKDAKEAHELNVAICNALLNEEWEMDHNESPR